MNKFAKTLEKLIAQKGITYQQLSEQTGIARSTIHDYTCTPKKVSIENIATLAKFFDVSIDRLLLDRMPIEAQRISTINDFKLKQIKTLIDN